VQRGGGGSCSWRGTLQRETRARSPGSWSSPQPGLSCHVEPARSEAASSNAEALRAIQALGELVHQELKVAHDRCNALQDALSDSVMAPVQRTGQQFADLDAKVQQLLGEAQDCSSRVEEHEVRLGVTRSKLDAHDQRLALLSDRLDRILRGDKASRSGAHFSMAIDPVEQDAPADVTELRHRLAECERRLGFGTGAAGGGASASSTPRGHTTSADGHAGGAATWGQAASAPDMQTQPATVALRLARCEQTATSLRVEVAERTSDLTDRIQASFQDLRAHLDAVSGQMSSLKEGVSRGEAMQAARIDSMEVRLGESENFAGTLCHGFEALQKLLGEVKRSLDVALTERRELRERWRVPLAQSNADLNGLSREEYALNASVQRRLDELAIKVGSLPSRLTALEERTGRAERSVANADERAVVLRTDVSQVQTQVAAAFADLSGRREAVERLQSVSGELREALTQQQYELARLADMASSNTMANAVGGRADGAEAGGGGTASPMPVPAVASLVAADAEAGGGGGSCAHSPVVAQSQHVALLRRQAQPDVGVAEAAGGGPPLQRRSPTSVEESWNRSLGNPSTLFARPTRRRSERGEASGSTTPPSRTAGAEAGGGAPYAGGFVSTSDYNGPETSAGIPRRGGAEAGGGPSPSQSELAGNILVQPGASGPNSPRQLPQLGSTHSPQGSSRFPGGMQSQLEGDGAAGGAPVNIPGSRAEPSGATASSHRAPHGDGGSHRSATASSAGGGDADEGGGEGGVVPTLERAASQPSRGVSQAGRGSEAVASAAAATSVDTRAVELEELGPTLLMGLGAGHRADAGSGSSNASTASEAGGRRKTEPPSGGALATYPDEACSQGATDADSRPIAEGAGARPSGMLARALSDDDDDDIEVLPDLSMGLESAAEGAGLLHSDGSSSEDGALAARVAQRLQGTERRAHREADAIEVDSASGASGVPSPSTTSPPGRPGAFERMPSSQLDEVIQVNAFSEESGEDSASN